MSRRLIDDFPRKLTQFELAKINTQLVHLLAPIRSQPTNKQSVSTSGFLDEKISLCLVNLPKWPISTSLRVLSEFGNIGDSSHFLDFIERAKKSDLNLHSQYQFLQVAYNNGLDFETINNLLSQIIVQLDALDRQQCVVVAEIAVKTRADVLPVLAQFADAQCDYKLHLALLPFRLSQGEIGLPSSLFPVLSTPELISVLHALCLCEFPDLVGATVAKIADCLSRLSFHRLTSDEEKTEIQSVLFKLKMKLDRMVYIDKNPFYKNIWLKKICKCLANNFEAETVPLQIASKQMLELIGLNVLRLDSIDTIANRIEHFGESLLIPMGPSSFANLTWALTHHPQAWKRIDKLRGSVATQLSNAFSIHMPKMTIGQIVTCGSSLMLIHNSAVRLVVSLAVSSNIPAILTLSNSDKLSLASIYAVLLKKNKNLSVDPLVQILHSVKLDELSLPQIVAWATVSQKYVFNCDVVAILESRIVHNGGSLSPSNTVKLLNYLASTDPANVSTLVRSLIDGLPSVTAPVQAARLLTILSSFSDPLVKQQSVSFVEDLLILLAVPGSMNVVLDEEPRIAYLLENSLDSLGDAGITFKQLLLS